MEINYSVLCHAINFVIWTSITTLLKDFTSCMEWYLLVIDSILSSKHMQAYMSIMCAPVCSCLHNLQQGGMIMLHKLFQRHEAFACHMFTDEKIIQGIFWSFYATKWHMPFLAMA